MWFNRVLVWFLLLVVLSIVQCRSTIDIQKSLIGDEKESPLDKIDDFAGPSDHAKVARDLVHQSGEC